MSTRPQWIDAARWGVCLILALGLHAAGAMVLLAHWQPAGEAVTSGPVILVDFAVEAAAPVSAQSDLPPGPSQPQADAEPMPNEPTETASITPEPQKPAETTGIKPEPVPEPEPEPVSAPAALDNDIAAQPAPMLTAMPPPRPRGAIERARTKEPKERNEPVKRQRRASLASAPSTAPRQARRAAAPAPGAGARDRHALPNWTSQLVARLERYKRYPAAAQARGEHGVAQLAFSVDRNGRVHNARIVRSSGSALLDRATLALVRRAQPLPPPPAAVPGARIPIVVPIHYRNR